MRKTRKKSKNPSPPSKPELNCSLCGKPSTKIRVLKSRLGDTKVMVVCEQDGLVEADE